NLPYTPTINMASPNSSPFKVEHNVFSKQNPFFCSTADPAPMMMGGNGQNSFASFGAGDTTIESSGRSINSFWKSSQFRNKSKFVAHVDSFAHFELQRFY